MPSECDKDLCVVLFHSNAEDIMSSLELGRFISEALECQVIIPEYRGYSLLQSEPLSPDGVRSDMLNMIHDVNQTHGIDFGDMILIVGSFDSREKALDLTFLRMWRVMWHARLL